MPYADNLYSAEDSDAESFSDELSPTDGYFTNREHPQDMMVPDPSLEVATGVDSAASKEQEARAEAEANPENRATGASVELPIPSPSQMYTSPTSPYTPSSPTSYTPVSPTASYRRHEPLATETSSLLHTRAPPPAYSPASPSSPSEPTRNYSTISNRELEAGTLPIREPESMGDPEGVTERTPLWRKKVRQISPWRRFITNCLLAALILAIASGFIVAAVKSGESKHGRNGDTSPPSKKLPPGGGSPPSKEPPSTDPGLPYVGNGPYCQAAKIRMFDDYMPKYQIKSGHEATVIQTVDNGLGPTRGAHVSTVGKVIVRPLPADAKDKRSGYVTIDAWTSHEYLLLSIEMQSELQALKIVSPQFTTADVSQEHCLSLEITIWLPDDPHFDNLTILTTELSIEVQEDVTLTITDKLQLSTISGSVRLPAINKTDSGMQPKLSQSVSSNGIFDGLFPSDPPHRGLNAREICVSTVSGSVKGTFPLYDVLKIETQSGSIDVAVKPKKAAVGAWKPAILTLTTVSGSIKAQTPIYDAAEIPDREYQTEVNSGSGSISGTYMIGTSALFKNSDGSIGIIVLPTAHSYAQAVFHTSTVSGSTHIKVLSPYEIKKSSSSPKNPKPIDIGNEDPYLLPLQPVVETDLDERSESREMLRNLESKHSGTNGSLRMLLPSEWEGTISMHTISGHLKVGGEGVEGASRVGSDWWSKQLMARKGPNSELASSVVTNGISGSGEIWVGECDVSSWCRRGGFPEMYDQE